MICHLPLAVTEPFHRLNDPLVLSPLVSENLLFEKLLKDGPVHISLTLGYLRDLLLASSYQI